MNIEIVYRVILMAVPPHYWQSPVQEKNVYVINADNVYSFI